MVSESHDIADAAFIRALDAAAHVMPGELIDRLRVIDALLDLRNATPSTFLVELIDGHLRAVPGQTTVRASWWRSVLDELNLAVAMEHSAVTLA